MAKAKYKEKDDTGRPQPVARDGAYVMMLFITLVAIIGGIVLLYFDNEDYGSKNPPKEVAPTVQPLGAAAKTDGAPPPPPGGGGMP